MPKFTPVDIKGGEKMNIPLYKKASEIESEIMPIVISFIEEKFPSYGIMPVKNYDKKNPYTKHWQDVRSRFIII